MTMWSLWRKAVIIIVIARLFSLSEEYTVAGEEQVVDYSG